MDPRKVSSLNGLHYREESYFDFVVSDRPKYTPGCGPAKVSLSVLLPHDHDGFIIEKAFIEKELVYIVGYEDNSSLRVSVRAQNILDWVSPRNYEQWECDDYDRQVREEEERELPALLARDAARRKRLLKKSREGGPVIDGRTKKRKARDIVEAEVDSDGPRKRGRPGRRPREGRGLSNTAPGSARKIRPEIQMFISPRRLSRVLDEPSLSTGSRGLADIMNLDSETDDDDDVEETDVEQALADQLNGAKDPSLSESSRSSLNSRKEQEHGKAAPSSHKRRRSFIGGDRANATAATSALDAFKVYDSIEKSHKKGDDLIHLSRSPFKSRSSMFSSPKQNTNTPLGRTSRETRSSSLRKSTTPLHPDDPFRRSVREKSTPIPQPPPPPSSSDESEEDVDDTEAEYEVEGIVAHKVRMVNGQKIHYYLVRWAGYSEAENSWEPAENVGKSAIEEYEGALRERARERSQTWNGGAGGFVAPAAPMD